MEVEYVSKKGLDQLKNYKYHGSDHSIIAPYLQPFWTGLVYKVPSWVAPNLITLTGFGFILASYLVRLYYCPHMEGDAPSWSFFFHAFCLFAYQTLDAIDGKQARRTATSSPLGELFDHGCDAMTTTFMVLTVTNSLHLGAGWAQFGLLLGAGAVFYFAQWEEYHTGILELGKINVTEIQIIIMIVHFVSGVFGASFWLTQFTVGSFSIQLNHLLAIGSGIGGLINIPENIRKIMQWQKTDAAKNFSNYSVYSKLAPLVATIVGACIWAILSPRIITVYTDIFLVTVGYLNAYLVGRIVLARVCGQDPLSIFQPILIPLAIGAANAALGHIVNEYYLLIAYFGLCIGAYLHFALWVIDTLCTYLNINCLTIRKNELKSY